MSWLANTILVIHVLFVVFVGGGLAFIWIGAWRGWPAVHGFIFRIAHLAAMLFVAAESLVGMVCPLTVWEDRLRGSAPDAGFVAYWLRRILYYDLPEWLFTAVYLLFALAVVATFVLVPPRKLPRT